MLKLSIALQAALTVLVTSMENRVITRRRDERGSITMEQVMWAVAVIAIVAIVVTAIQSFVTTEAAKIK